MNAFYVQEGNESNEWAVGITEPFYNFFKGQNLSGSYNIIAARILGFTYSDYLRYVRQNYNATLRGRQGYSYAIYKNEKDCQKIVKDLNDFWHTIENNFVRSLER